MSNSSDQRAAASSRVLILGLCCTLASSACGASTDSQSVELYDPNGYEEAWERYLASARPTPDGGLFVEGDLYFPSEDALRAYFDAGMEQDIDKAHAFKQQSTGYIPAFAFPSSVNIRYCVSNTFGTGKATWVTAIANAARAWQDVANIRFTYLSAHDANCSSATAGVDFAVVRMDWAGGYCGASKMLWPAVGGCSTGTGVIEIDTLQDMTFGGAAPNVTPTGALRHEIGHVLGLRHEHAWRSVIDPSCSEQPTYAVYDLTGAQLGSVAYDQMSVMHYPFNGPVYGHPNLCGGNPQSTFSLTLADGHSAQVLYGMHPAWVVALM